MIDKDKFARFLVDCYERWRGEQIRLGATSGQSSQW